MASRDSAHPPDGDAERADRDLDTVSGALERVVFSSEASHWTVARLRRDDGSDDLVTVVGALLYGLGEGTPLRLGGTWQEHPKYGRQLRVETYQVQAPETLLGVERYLASGVPGVGAELAKRLVAHFGLDALDIIRTAPHRLIEVDGIGKARAEKIAAAWHDERERQDIMVFLHGYGVSAALAQRIFKRYGQDTMALIRENPYRLALDIWGIGFKTADAIAKNLGLESTAPERLEAGLVHTLGTLADDDGHVHVPRLELIERAGELLGVDVRLLVPALDALERSELVICESLGDRGECVSLAPMWRAESESAAAMIELLTTPMRPLPIDLDRALEAFEERVGLRLAAAQRRAVRAAIADKCVVITGGPGVGKTTIVRAIIDILSAAEHSDGDDAERRVVLAAPTGRAAKRLSESTDRDAVTIHRLLEFQPQHGHFARDESQPLDADVVIIDEVSMVDIALLRALLAATPRPAQLILVGDIDQLPSVGPGAVLADIIASEAATVVRLTEIFRQAAQSRIITAAHQINQGVVPELAPPPGRDAHRSDFYFIPRDDPDTARQTIITLVAERIPESFGYAAPDDIQVLSPMHRGELGTRALNDALQARLNPGGTGVPELTRGDRAFRAGDKVMQVRNDYDRAVFNGDIGHITDVIMSKGDSASLLVEFPGDRVCRYQRDDLDQIIHAYAVSVHKSQGSEYPVVILPLVTQHFIMLRRNLLYTAITRGKKLVVVVGSRRAVALATRNHQTGMRWTWLAERIRAGVSGAL